MWTALVIDYRPRKMPALQNQHFQAEIKFIADHTGKKKKEEKKEIFLV